jgi:hypothetical protein
MPIKLYLRNIFILVLLVIIIGPGVVFPQETDDKARRFTRETEFNYLDWTLNAFWVKITKGKSPKVESGDQQALVYTYLSLVAEVQSLDNQIAIQYADPAIVDPAESSKGLIAELAKKQAKLQVLTPKVEDILQDQVKTVVLTEDLDSLSVIIPPILYHTSDMPLSLLISPRDRIQLDANISLLPGMSDAQKVELEKEVETGMNVSALVEEIGGLGTYPSMIMMTTDLNWLVETIAHEWAHNYLTLHPLGQNYETSPELRTMNETTANLAGKEIGQKVIELYYPERIPASKTSETVEPTTQTTPPVFDFREQMRITREHVDQLLAAGEIEEAEAYMEVRRHVFWDNGYMIRRINQAYFAFHGAYNDTPGGGASGTDPVGPAVVILREMSGNLGKFLRTIAGMSSYSQLETAIGSGGN